MDKIWGIQDNDAMQYPCNIPNQRGTWGSRNCNVNWVTVLNRNNTMEGWIKMDKKERGAIWDEKLGVRW